ncbi:MAG: ABC transporter ATP-binding protein [Prosthecochloris sp.]|nr:ABC transporter ATP-binding protein [Prosthecochloris sp.]
MSSLISLEHLGFSYDSSSAPLFDDVNLEISRGDFLLIRGASGTGKSTLLRLVCRLQPHSRGRILFKGRTVESIPPAELRRQVLYTTQLPAMMDGTVRANLLFPFSFESNREKAVPPDDALRGMLEEFYLHDIPLDHHALNLSVGQQQRVALMRAILQKPEVILFDEPTSALDGESASMVFRIIEHLNRDQQMTVVMVTHSDYRPERITPAIYLLEHRKLRRL